MATEKTYLIVESFNSMGYHAVAIGDDDLSLGKNTLLEISKKANFPFLSSNILDEESGKPLFQPYLLKEVDGLKIGIFSLIAPESFLGPEDPRRKGLTIQSPVEAAQNMVKELQPKTDLIILLSHLGYPRDYELAQMVSGIHVIVGSHTGINIPYPPVVKNTIILQAASKGMYAGRFDLFLYNSEPNFYHTTLKRTLENNLKYLKNRLASAEVSGIEGMLQQIQFFHSRFYNTTVKKSLEEVIKTAKELSTSLKLRETEKSKWLKVKLNKRIDQTLEHLEGENEFTNTLFALSEQMKDHPEILKMVNEFKAKYPETRNPPPK